MEQTIFWMNVLLGLVWVDWSIPSRGMKIFFALMVLQNGLGFLLAYALWRELPDDCASVVMPASANGQSDPLVPPAGRGERAAGYRRRLRRPSRSSRRPG